MSQSDFKDYVLFSLNINILDVPALITRITSAFFKDTGLEIAVISSMCVIVLSSDRQACDQVLACAFHGLVLLSLYLYLWPNGP